MNDLVDRLLLRDRSKRWRLADEVRAPCPSSLLGASARVALRASEVAGEDLRKEAMAGERACCRAARPWPGRGRVAGPGGCAPRVVPRRGLPRQGREGASGRCSSADRRAFQAHGRRGAPRPPARLRGSARGLGRSERGGVPCRVERLPGSPSLSRSDRIHSRELKRYQLFLLIGSSIHLRAGAGAKWVRATQPLGGDACGRE